MFGGRDGFAVCGRPNYAIEDWCSMPEVLAFIRDEPDPAKYKNNANLAGLMQENYETICHFFSPAGESLRKIKFAEWVENHFWRLKNRGWK